MSNSNGIEGYSEEILNKGWQLKKLSEVCIVQRGSSPRPIKNYFTTEPNGVNWIKIGDTEEGEKYIYSTAQKITPEGAKQSRFVKEGDFILTNSMSFGRPYIMKIDGYIHDGWFVLRLKEFIDIDYFYYLLSSDVIQSQFLQLASGSIVQNISGDLVKRAVLPIPPLPEQQRIVSILEEAFAAIAQAKAKAEQNRQNASALFESHLQSVFTQRGPGWVEKRLEQVTDATCSLSYGIVQPGEEYADGIPVVRPTDLTTKIIYPDGLKRINPKLADGYKRTTLHGGELLLCVRGSTGVISIAAPELVGANVTRGIVPIRFDHSLLLPEFGFYLISSGPVQSQIRAKTYGTALMQINIRDLRIISFSIPPLKEQGRIATKLDALYKETQHLEALYQRKIAALDELKQALLHQAFSGQL